MTLPAQTPHQRKRDALSRLERDGDAWAATASEGGTPYRAPLSFLWDGATLLIATPVSSPTGRNLQATGRVRLGIGPTRDVVVIEGAAEALALTEIAAEVGDAFGQDRLRPAAAHHPVPLLPHSSAAAPGVARSQRSRRPRADARWRLGRP